MNAGRTVRTAVDLFAIATEFAMRWIFFAVALGLAVIVNANAGLGRWHLLACILSGVLVGFTLSDAQRVRR